MTVNVETPANPSGTLKKGRKFLWSLVIALGVAAVCAWIALGVGLWLDVERPVKLGMAIAAALATEGLMWTTAAALGVSVLEARKRIWKRITGRG